MKTAMHRAILLSMILASAAFDRALAGQQNRITGISPECAAPGDSVTITGFGFGAFNVVVTVGDVQASVRQATGNSVTFTVPANAPLGATTVEITHRRGGQRGSIGFRVGCADQPSEGVVLPGLATSPAAGALSELLPEAVADDQIEDGIIMTRLDVWLEEGATIGQVNAALGTIGAGIVGMRPGFSVIVIAVPRAANIDSLFRSVEVLKAAPGINSAFLAIVSVPDVLPPLPAGDPAHLSLMDHLEPTRFPAAWNAMNLATDGCQSHKVKVVVTDEFAVPPPVGYLLGFPSEIGSMTPIGVPATNAIHGYDVATTMAARLDFTHPTGANPFPDCLEIHAIQVGNLSVPSVLMWVASAVPNGKFLWNNSRGYLNEFCDPAVGSCAATDVNKIVPPLFRARDAVDWKAATRTRWDDFLMITAAGNDRNKLEPQIYPGLATATFESEMNFAAFPDPLFGLIDSPALWDPQPGHGTFLPLRPSVPDQVALLTYINNKGLASVGGADNVIIAGSTGNAFFAVNVRESDFSNGGADMYAVGEEVFTLGGDVQGTSFSAPQVTGLAAYLWMLSPEDLFLKPAQITKRAIEANTRAVSQTTCAPGAPVRSCGSTNTMQVVDAYATVLSLDSSELPDPQTAPVRLAILDVTGPLGVPDGKFNALDLDKYLSNLPTVSPGSPDYSRFDLNGDGETGGPNPEKFDLDRVGSTQFGETIYSSAVLKDIEGATVSFNETALSDIEILCYYAYSDLYTGTADERGQRLDERGCAVVQVTVAPAVAALGIGEPFQFHAAVLGAHDRSVTWEATGGTIDTNGRFTAGSTPGDFVVSATSVADPSKFDLAAVTIEARCALSCDDGNDCTDDRCGLFCNLLTTKACSTNADCAAGQGTCVPGCGHTNNASSCSDGSVCTNSDRCSGGVCVSGPALDCNDHDACTDDSCDPARGCVHVNNTGTVLLTASLDGAQVVPASSSAATGSCSVILDGATGLVTVDCTYQNLTSARDVQHVHGGASPGVNGAVIVVLNGTGGTSGQLFAIGSLTPQQMCDMLNGLTYIDVHTTNFPNGEIRGQIEP